MKFNEEILAKEEGGGMFVKLKDKESVAGIFMGDIHEFYTLWGEGGVKEVPRGTPGASFRFRANFIVKEGDHYVAKIFEQGKTVYRDLAEINKEYPLETIVIKITRSGSTKSDTSYNLLPLLKTPLTDQVKKQLESVQLLPLTKPSQGASSDDSEDLPF